MSEKKSGNFLIKALAVLLVLGFVVSKLTKNDKSEAKVSAKKDGLTPQVLNKPFEMPLKIEEEAFALDSLTVIDNLSVILRRKNPNRVEIYNYVNSSYEVAGVQCSLEICKNLKYAMRRLKEVAQNPNDTAAISESGQYLKMAAKDATLLKSKELYKVTQRKPLFVDEAVYAVESDVNDRGECKLLGDAIHIMKKQAVVVFVRPGKQIAKKIDKKDFANIACIYRYNYGLKKYTQVLLSNELEQNFL